MKIYNIINIPKGLSPENECDCQGEYNSGYTEGLEEGFDKGYDSGYTDGFADGYDSGRTDGYDDGWQPGYNSGYTDGLNAAGGDYASGYTDGFAVGYESGSTDGWGSGYDSGYTDGLNACSGGTGNEDLIANLQGDYFLIPEGTTHLRDYAFTYCEIAPSVSAFTIPDSVTGIGKDAFANSKGAQSITIPDSVTEIEQRAFYASSPTHIVLGSGLTLLPNNCFSSSKNLIDITIPSGITTIGSGCFNGCNGLTAMTFESLTPPGLVGGICLGSSALTFPFFVPCEAVDTYKTAWSAFPYYVDRITCGSSEKPRRIIMELDNPLVISGETSFTTEPADAYLPTPTYYSEDETIATVDSAGTVTVVSEGTVRISANFKYGNATLIASKEIQTRLTPVPPVPSGVQVDVIYNVETTSEPTKILNTNFGDYWNYIIDARLDDSTPVPISSGQTSPISGYTFPTTGLNTVHYTISGDTIGSAFASVYPVVSANIHEGITSTTGHLFDACMHLSAVTLPSTLTGTLSCFSDCTSLTGITIPAGVTGIGESCFYRNYSLTSVVIPSGVSDIGVNCFGDCSGLTAMTFEGTVPATLHTPSGAYTYPSLGQYTYTFPIYVPCEAVEDYKAAWPEYANRITCTPSHDGMLKIVYDYDPILAPQGTLILKDRSTIISAELEDGTEIPLSASPYDTKYIFPVTGLNSVYYELQDGQSLNEDCFVFCESLVSADIPSGVTVLGNSCFSRCTSLSSITIPNTVTGFGHDCFNSAVSLSHITIPESMQVISGWCFYDCPNLTAMTFEGTTPPSLAGINPLGDGVTTPAFAIYVPASAVNTYKAAWPDYASRIQAITD